MQPIKLGIIGCGIAARDLHWPALRQLRDEFEITAVCNHTEPKAKEFARLVGDVPYVLDYHDLLNQDDVEAVDIILPIHLNHRVSLDVLAAGKHLIVEKPLGANMKEAEELLEVDSKSPLVKMVAENFRYNPVFIKTKAYLDEGRIGIPHTAFWDQFFLVDHSNKYAMTSWRINHQYPGGFILDGGIHNIAALRDMLGEIVAGTAFTRSINPNIGEIDSLVFRFQTENRVAGVLNICLSVKGLSENRLQIFGDEGSITVEGKTIRIAQENQKEHTESVNSDGGYKAQFEDFYHSIRASRAPRSSFSQAFQDLKVMIAALESAQKGETFRLNSQ